jgi:molybdate transport system ATP-binding protein
MTATGDPVAALDACLDVHLGPLHLDRVTLSVAPGASVAVVGPNGAGKTTLLRALTGLVALEGGHVRLDGTVLDDPATATWRPPSTRPIGVMFQDLLLFPHLSVLENVAFGPRSRGAGRRSARGRAAAWLDRLGVAHLAGVRPGALSGGQAQRVALARALATEPRLLLLDEPLSALDAVTRPTVRRDLARHLDDFEGVTVIVTHDPVEAMTLARHVIVLEAGRVSQQGDATDLRERPRSEYVAEFVGVNLYRGTGTPEGLVLTDGARIVGGETAVRGAALAVVHPRAVALHRTRPAGTPRNVWSGTVRDIDREGDRARVHVDGAVPVTAEVTAASVAELGIAIGAPVWASVKATEVAVFPA